MDGALRRAMRCAAEGQTVSLALRAMFGMARRATPVTEHALRNEKPSAQAVSGVRPILSRTRLHRCLYGVQSIKYSLTNINRRLYATSSRTMLLISSTVGPFRSISSAQLVQIDPTVTVLVGMNEAGKTVFLQALQKQLWKYISR